MQEQEQEQEPRAEIDVFENEGGAMYPEDLGLTIPEAVEVTPMIEAEVPVVKDEQ